MRWWIAGTVTLVMLGASVAQGKMLRPKMPEVVASPVEDKAGHDADRELDFRRLQVETTAEHLELIIDFWTAWEELETAAEYRVTVSLSRPKSKLFLPHNYGVERREDGTLEIDWGRQSGTFVDEAKRAVWKPTDEQAESLVATLEGTRLTLQIPWDALPFEDLWVQVSAMHAVDDEVAEEEGISHRSGSLDAPPNDMVPNKMKVVAVSRPR